MIFTKSNQVQSKINLLNLVIVLALFAFMTATSLKAQTTLTCPDPDPCGTAWTTATFHDWIGTYGVLMEYYGTYEWRDCGGTYQIRNYQVTSAPSSNLWNEGYHYQEHFSGLLEYIEIESLNALIANVIGIDNVPDCSTSTMKMATVYSAACGVWLRCSYLTTEEPTVEADGPSQTGYVCPTPQKNKDGKYQVDTWHYEPCGDICCEKTYEICKQPRHTGTGYDIVIKNINRHVLAGSTCTKQGQFTKWDYPGTVIDCVDGCQGDGN